MFSDDKCYKCLDINSTLIIQQVKHPQKQSFSLNQVLPTYSIHFKAYMYVDGTHIARVITRLNNNTCLVYLLAL